MVCILSFFQYLSSVLNITLNPYERPAPDLG
jgi:hypothetical protein